jgi:hypothetical protein
MYCVIWDDLSLGMNRGKHAEAFRMPRIKDQDALSLLLW